MNEALEEAEVEVARRISADPLPFGPGDWQGWCADEALADLAALDVLEARLGSMSLRRIFSSSEETISSGSRERANKTKKKTPGNNRRKELDLSRDIQPSRDDVLSGRGGNYNIHLGNIRFTKKALELLPKYLSCSKLDKELLSVELMESVTSVGHHFLDKGQDGKWYKLDEKCARKKASQKFRDLHKKKRESDLQ